MCSTNSNPSLALIIWVNRPILTLEPDSKGCEHLERWGKVYLTVSQISIRGNPVSCSATKKSKCTAIHIVYDLSDHQIVIRVFLQIGFIPSFNVPLLSTPWDHHHHLHYHHHDHLDLPQKRVSTRGDRRKAFPEEDVRASVELRLQRQNILQICSCHGLVNCPARLSSREQRNITERCVSLGYKHVRHGNDDL